MNEIGIYSRLFSLIFTLALCLGGCAQRALTDLSVEALEVSASESSEQQKDHSEAVLYHVNLDERGRALRGYDPVTYFTHGKPIEGRKEFSTVWNNAYYYFISAENRDKFMDDPGKYSPANGGYCTFGIVLEKKFDGDPKVWLIHEDNLYVFLNKDVKEKFIQDKLGNLSRVAQNWSVIRDKSPEEL